MVVGLEAELPADGLDRQRHVGAVRGDLRTRVQCTIKRSESRFRPTGAGPARAPAGLSAMLCHVHASLAVALTGLQGARPRERRPRPGLHASQSRDDSLGSLASCRVPTCQQNAVRRLIFRDGYQKVAPAPLTGLS